MNRHMFYILIVYLNLSILDTMHMQMKNQSNKEYGCYFMLNFGSIEQVLNVSAERNV